MNAIKEAPEVMARRKAATLAAADRFHRTYHELKGADAPCEVCRPADVVPDIHDPQWKGYGASTEDVLVAPPNARNVTPR